MEEVRSSTSLPPQTHGLDSAQATGYPDPMVIPVPRSTDPSKENPAGEISEINPKGILKHRVPWSREEDRALYSYMHAQGWSSRSCRTRSIPWKDVAKGARLTERNGKSCRERWINYLDPGINKKPLTEDEKDTIISLEAQYPREWATIAKCLPGRTPIDIKNFFNAYHKRKMKKISKKEVTSVAMGLNTTGKSCRLRRNSCLRPDINKGPWTPAEETTVLQLQKQYPKLWSSIAASLPGRTEAAIKNLWNTKLKNMVASETEVHAHEHLEQHNSHQEGDSSTSTGHGHGGYYASNEQLLKMTTTTSLPPDQAVLESTGDGHGHQIINNPASASLSSSTNIEADMRWVEELLLDEITTSGVGDDKLEEMMRGFVQELLPTN